MKSVGQKLIDDFGEASKEWGWESTDCGMDESVMVDAPESYRTYQERKASLEKYVLSLEKFMTTFNETLVRSIKNPPA